MGWNLGEFPRGLAHSFVRWAGDIISMIVWLGRQAFNVVSYCAAKNKAHKKALASHKPRIRTITAAEPMFIPVDKNTIRKVSLDDVIGLGDAKEEINEMAIKPVDFADKAKQLNIVEGGGIILVGPKGNGKSLLAIATANSLLAAAAANGVDMVVFEITAADIIRRSQAACANRVRELFRTVRMFERVVLIINEFDGLTNEKSPIQRSFNTQFLNETDGFLEISRNNKMLMMIGTSNSPKLIPDAVNRPGRINKMIFVGLPDMDARKSILIKAMEDVSVSDDIDYERIASETRLFSCADLVNELVQAARRHDGYARSVKLPKNQVHPVCMADFTAALAKTKPSTTAEELAIWYPDGRLEKLT